MRASRRIGLVGAVIALLPALAARVDGAPVARDGDVMAIVQLELGLEEPAFQSATGFVLSTENLLIVVGQDRTESAAAVLAAHGGEVLALDPETALPLWTSVGRISDGTAAELGIKIIHRGETSTVFEAHPDNAYRLLERGFFVVEVRLRPIADLKREHFGAGLTGRLLEGRPLTEARKRFVMGLAESVSPDTLRDRIYYLNYDDAAQAYRSRFAPRHEVRQEITPYLRDLLAAYVVPDGGTVEVQEFKPDLPDTNLRLDDTVFVNVVASLPGRKTSAHYIVCAHYDAIGVNDPAWRVSPTAWMGLAAPGADDNATGTAAVLEAARLMSGLDLDVGVKFIAFSGEELGLLGSSFYVDGLSPDDSILGVINLDMVGYVEDGKYIGVTYDRKSQWLSDLLQEVAETTGLESETEAYDRTGVHNSDHASFWSAGTPGVMLADRPDPTGGPLYPYYHTLADTLGNIDIDQVSDNAKLVVSFLARFAEVQEDTLSDIALTQGSVQWAWEGSPYTPLVAGDSVWANLRAVNLGGSMLTSEFYRLQVWQGESSSGRLVHEGTTSIEALSGEYALARASWRTDPNTFGEVRHTFAFRPIADGVESDLADNIVSVPLYMMPPTTVVKNLHVYPNPVTEPADANLSFEIWHPYWQGLDNTFTGKMDFWIFDLEGSQVGRGTLLRTLVGDRDIALGENRVGLERYLSNGNDLAPGLYICFAELKVTGEAGIAKAKTKFAIAR